MSWQTLLAIHLLFSTAFALVIRRLASNLVGFGRIVAAVSYLSVILPGGVVFALMLGDISFSLSPATWFFLVLGGLLFAIFNFLAYRANEELDAAQFAIITNLEPLFVIALASLFLGERLTAWQLLGAFLVIGAAADVAIEKVGPRTFRFKAASLIALASSLFLGAAITNEKALLSRMTYATYLILGWSMQAGIIGLFALRDRRKISQISRKQFLEMICLGLLRLGAGLSGTAALRLVDASVVSSVRSYKPVLIFVAAFVFLGERRDFRRRMIGAILATLGLLLLI